MIMALAQFIGLALIGGGCLVGLLAFIRYQDLKRSNPWEHDL